MTSIELYINQQLCDIENPDKLGVRLNKVLINPSELSTKDAQYSYSLTIPSTPVNDAIFKYINVEEVKDKFNTSHSAQLYVDGLKVFDGRFKISEIDQQGNYKGNLVIPAPKTVKDIFGETKMNQTGEWNIDFKDMVASLNKYNRDKGTPPCIFPLVLYGLLPKVAADPEGKTYTSKKEWDKYVRLGIEDFPPSVNCLQMLKQIFENYEYEKGKKYKLTGSAFNDSRLTELYVSYKNPTDYVQPWNWGDLGKFSISGNWSNHRKEVVDGKEVNYVETMYAKNNDGRLLYVTNLFNSSMTRITNLDDRGTNVLHSVVKDKEKKKRHSSVNVTIPVSGLYKVSLNVNMLLDSESNTFYNKRNPKIITANFGGASNNLNYRAHEVKILRDFGSGDFDIESAQIDGLFFSPNLPQDNNWEENKGSFPKYFPVPGKQCVLFVDPCVNYKLVSGFHWGSFKGTDDAFPYGRFPAALRTKVRNDRGQLVDLDELNHQCSILAIKNGWSWDVKYDQKEKIFSTINNVPSMPEVDKDGKPIAGKNRNGGYWMYGPSDQFESDEDDPEIEGLGDDDEVSNGWYPSRKFKVELKKDGANGTLIKEGNEVWMNSNAYEGHGRLHQVIWLKKGERLTLVSVSDSGVDRKRNKSKGYEGWMKQTIDFNLEVEPFMPDWEWIKVDKEGNGEEAMDWAEDADMQREKINLIKFLPSDMKMDEWVDNFCKAFNLSLSQLRPGEFELNVKPVLKNMRSFPIALDGKASILHRTNEALGLPSEYKLGFRVNQEEQGFYDSVKNDPDQKGDDGGGSLLTGNIDGKVVSQSSSFSYCWYQDIDKVDETGFAPDGVTPLPPRKTPMRFPIISNKEVWDTDVKEYGSEMKKLYTGYGQRFWYRKQNTLDVGSIWKNKGLSNGAQNADKLLSLQIADVSNRREGKNPLELDYHDQPESILKSYFNVQVTDDSNYTLVECSLTPREYAQLNAYQTVSLNGDVYYVGSIEGYDPTGRNPTKLKLIRRV